MARRKRWFLSRLWLVKDRQLALKMFGELGLSSDQIRAIIKRFWDGQPVKSIGEMTAYEQKKLLPVWDHWAERWCREHRERFSAEEVEVLGLEKEKLNG